jgi:hypothetical protein
MEKCIRCARALTQALDQSTEVEFFVCEHCQSHYARKPGQALHDRWLMPLSVVLYPVLFDKEPCGKAAGVAKSIIEKGALDIARIKEHILDEIKVPKQKVSQILDFAHPDEEQLRQYLMEVHRCLESANE